jgi:WS/DGAT/MGAT family acyltransferase
MKRLSGLDGALLAAETRVAPLHMMAILRLEPATVPGGYTFEKLRDFIASRLALVPPLRYRLVETPLHLAPPMWAELEHVDIDHHVKRAALPAPGGPRELADFASRLAEHPLDRRFPLWEMYVVEKVYGGEVAIVAKVHHALMDGAAGMAFMAALFSLDPEIPEAEATEPIEPDEIPPTGELVAQSIPRLGKGATRLVPVLGRTISGVIRAANRIVRGTSGSQKPSVLPAPRVPWSGEITNRRNLAFTSVPLDDVKRIAKDNGVKVNDVVLSIFGGALRSYLDVRDALPDAPLVASVPVSLRTDGDLGGNMLSVMFVTLGTDIADPFDRLRDVREHATSAREMHETIGGDTLLDWTDVFAPAVFSLGANLLIDRKLLARMPAVCNAIVSNVPGPPVTLYFGGARLIAVHPFGPIVHGAAINLTVVSARDTIGFGLLSCPDLVPDVWELVAAIQAEYTVMARSVPVG